MTTESLIRQPPDSVAEAVRALLGQSAIEPGASVRLSVAEAADLVGLSVHTLRYYEQQGLVRPGRNSSGYREYSEANLRRLVFITRMRRSGMTMQDLRRYVSLSERGLSTEPERREIMVQQRDRIRQQIRELTLALETTEYKIVAYDGHPDDRLTGLARGLDGPGLVPEALGAFGVSGGLVCVG